MTTHDDPTSANPLVSAISLHSTAPNPRERYNSGEKTLPVYLSLEEAAEVMSLSVKTIRRRIADGTIPAYQCGRRPIRIRLGDLEAALRRIPSARW